MKKRVLSLILILLLLAALAPTGLAAEVVLSPQNLTVNGVPIRCEKYNIDGSNYFKLRDLAFLLNGTGSQFAVGYDETLNTVTIVTGQPYEPNGSELLFSGEDKSSETVPSRQTILIDGQTVSDLSVYNIGGSNFFKLRELGFAVGFDVDYDGATNTAFVMSRSASDLTELTPEQIYARCSPAVFYMEIYDETGWCTKTGSGFFLRDDGLAVTNYHVISGAASATVTLAGSGAVYDVLGVYDFSAEEDWAVLQIGGANFQTLEIGDASYDVGGATVYAIGSPLGLQNTISSGIISNPARKDGSMTYIQMSAAISPGSSGGALLNKYGQVIGITSATYSDGQNLNLAIPMTYLAEMDTSAYTPLNSLADSPSGTVTLSENRMELVIGRPGSITVTAVENNVSGVSVRYSVAKEDVAECSWGAWNGDDIDLTVTPLAVGSTEITVYFIITGTDVVLDSKTLYVTVAAEGIGSALPEGVEFGIDHKELSIGLFGSGSIGVHACYLPDNANTTVSYFIEDPSVLACEWDEWDGDDIRLLLNPLSAGSTTVTVVYHRNDGSLLAQGIVTVTVVYGTLQVSEDELGLEVGESLDLIVTLSSDSPHLLTLEYEIYGEGVVSAQWGEWLDDACTVCPLTVSALEAGEADVEIRLLDKEDGITLYTLSVPVSVG